MAGLGRNNKRLEYKQELEEPDQEPNRDIATPHVWLRPGTTGCHALTAALPGWLLGLGSSA